MPTSPGRCRVAAIAHFFGRSPGVEAYTAAWTVPNTIYDMLISGIASAALVPVLSEYAEGDQREFARVVSSANSSLLEARGKKFLLADHFVPGFMTELMRKDMALAVSLALPSASREDVAVRSFVPPASGWSPQ